MALEDFEGQGGKMTKKQKILRINEIALEIDRIDNKKEMSQNDIDIKEKLEFEMYKLHEEVQEEDILELKNKAEGNDAITYLIHWEKKQHFPDKFISSEVMEQLIEYLDTLEGWNKDTKKFEEFEELYIDKMIEFGADEKELKKFITNPRKTFSVGWQGAKGGRKPRVVKGWKLRKNKGLKRK